VKILLLDIETAPNLAYVWGAFKQNITMDKIVENSEVLCWSAKWYGQPGVHYRSNQTGKVSMLRAVHKLLDEADVVVTYNGQSFDTRVLNREFLLAKLLPPSPYKQIDLYRVVTDRFDFPINKLDYVLKRLGFKGKVRHPGFQMWVDCAAGDAKAWAKMAAYNKRDTTELEQLYEVLRPWVRNHPNTGAFDGRPDACPTCGEEGKLQRRGFAVTRDVKYPRFQCGGCGSWLRGKKAVDSTRTTLQGVA
jgi:DNA polymerase elongation subunit (family B)